ncbi:hypothetical protein [Vibrio parahaemolyticus]|nr:hypothetical protein [Vibrio parahaemolyticus]MBE4032810.1 hypothetical protein [Vibrio parahaemolyticus]ODW48805.1 hypothetical protein BBL86_19865 [Vibrio parahaemolyticus]
MTITLAFLALHKEAHADSADICKEIVKFGVHDKYGTFTTEYKFRQVLQLFTTKEYESYDKAKSSKLELGIDIIDIIDVSLGGTTNESNYIKRRSELLKLSFSQVSSNYSLISRVEVASRAISNAFVQCVQIRTQKDGFTAWIQPSRNKKSFVINAKRLTSSGGNSFEINSISAVPAICSITSFPHRVEGDISIACENESMETIQVSMDTTAGDLTGVDVPGFNDSWFELQTRINRLENAGGLVQQGTVAFFDRDRCPSGWETYKDAQGRYILAIDPSRELKKKVGTALSDGENRPTGLHKHHIEAKHRVKANYTPGGKGDIDWYEHTYTTSDPIPQKGMSFIEGTNAPYIQLLACKKL